MLWRLTQTWPLRNEWKLQRSPKVLRAIEESGLIIHRLSVIQRKKDPFGYQIKWDVFISLTLPFMPPLFSHMLVLPVLPPPPVAGSHLCKLACKSSCFLHGGDSQLDGVPVRVCEFCLSATNPFCSYEHVSLRCSNGSCSATDRGGCLVVGGGRESCWKRMSGVYSMFDMQATGCTVQ